MKIQFLENIISKLPFNKNKDNASASNEDRSSSAANINFFAKYNISMQFVISGICIVASIAIYFIFVSPLKSKNIELKNDLNAKVEKLERFVRKGKNI